jgi:hypothetical protein
MASEDLEARLAALEGQVRELTGRVQNAEQGLTAARQDSAAARVLAGGADRDVIEIRSEIRDFRHATVSTLNAMREDLTDMRTRFDQGFAEMRGKLDAAAAGQAQIVTLLTTFMERDSE